MKNLHELYTEVVASCPEAEIVGLEYNDDGIWSIDVPQIEGAVENQLPGDEWKKETEYDEQEFAEGAAPLPSHMMAGIILSHWLSLFSPGDMLQHGKHDGVTAWWCVSHGFGYVGPPSQSPVHAVGEFIIDRKKRQAVKEAQ